jgi:hypothetical protein
MPELLSTSLYREVRDPAFFRVLAGKNAPTYVDVLDVLDRECTEQADGLDRNEAIEIIADVLAKHPEYQPEADEMAAESDLLPAVLPMRESARRVLDHLARCRWLEEPPRKDWRRRLYFDAHGSTLISALRQIAHPEAAVFTDKLTAVCATLANEVELIERPLTSIENALAFTRQGLGELRTMQKSVQRLTRRQLEADTLKGNLALVFDDYAEQVAHGAYAELIRARLPVRLPDAVRRIAERLLDDSTTLAEMQTELLRRDPQLSAEAANAKVRQKLDDLSHLLEMVLPMADEIDRRTADFTRRSLARFRYLQDVTGERRGEIRTFFETVNRQLSGKRLSSGWELANLPALRLPETRLPAGLDSLYAPPSRRVIGEQSTLDDEVTDEERADAKRDMERSLRESLSVRRANEFVSRLPGGKGTRLSSAELPVITEEDLSEIIALLLHAESSDATYRIETGRSTHPDDVPVRDPLPGAKVEHFDLIKK